MRDTSGALCLLDVNVGELVYADGAGDDPKFLFPIAFDMSIASGYIESGLMPEEGCCFGYKKELVAGGSLDASNVYVAILEQYLDFMGDFHHEIQDVADGETVMIKTVRTHPN
jgi:hypothetical protein